MPTAVEKSPAYINVTQIYSRTRPHHRADTSQGVLRAPGAVSEAGEPGVRGGHCARSPLRERALARLSGAHANVDVSSDALSAMP